MGSLAVAPALTVTGFLVVGACSGQPGQSSPAAGQQRKSLLSELLSTTPIEAGGSGTHGQMWTDSESEVYSDDEEDAASEGAVAIAIRDEDHYKRMLRARAIVNCRLWQQHQQPQ